MLRTSTHLALLLCVFGASCASATVPASGDCDDTCSFDSDAGAPPAPDADTKPDAAQMLCGDGTCESSLGESCANCETDCGSCCGNAMCEPAFDENCETCAEDCGVCPPDCGDGTCEAGEGESCATCPSDCGGCCGDSVCDASESCSSCPVDCAPPDGPLGLSPGGGATISGSSVPLDWDPHCAATAYDVGLYFWQASSSSWVEYYTWSTPDDFFTVWPVVDADFYFQVRVTNAGGTGPWSDPSYFTFVETP